MSAATRATTASERANIAASYLRKGRTENRALFDCFEMGDGDEVKAILVQKAATDSRLADYALRAGWINAA